MVLKSVERCRKPSRTVGRSRKVSDRRCESAADHIERPQARDKAPASERLAEW